MTLNKGDLYGANLRSKGQTSRSLGKEMLKIVLAHIFVKSGSIYVNRRLKWSPAHYTHIVKYFHQRKCFVLWYLSIYLPVTYLSFSQYWNGLESLYFSLKLPITLVKTVIVRAKGQRSRPQGTEM